MPTVCVEVVGDTADEIPAGDHGDAELARLADRCEAGDDEAVADFVRKFDRLLMSISLRMLRDRQEAEDVVQESFVRILRSLSKWDRNRPIVPWLTTITMNRCRTALSKRPRRAKPVEELPKIEAAVEPDALVQAEQRELLDRVTAELPENWREAVVLFYGAGLSCDEVAETLGCAEGTVKTWLFRARGRMAERIRAIQGDDDRFEQESGGS